MRWLFAALVLLGLGGCINLPASLEREFACPPAGADSHYGEPGKCSDKSGS